ncbi:hypothetical protein GQ43DRAFT_439384 [Delitschia confertaspora ATCC 74209]|uniref:Uncharacterized protein n=1 Tax=Delitschia confertaspora ATCC 74209 TaxID=1513339 RepID=A0A9P4JR44_9PLEO|nr:hypothetical protein GQ43DRAFT_439384 [Delitschia confertaspora ATCC 74209]
MSFRQRKQLVSELSGYFQIPNHMLSDVYRRSKGFFSFEGSYDKDGLLQSHGTWFRVLVKTITQDTSSSYT